MHPHDSCTGVQLFDRSPEVNGVKSLSMNLFSRRPRMSAQQRTEGFWAAHFAAARFAVIGLVLLFGFSAVFATAFHNPQPHQVKVAVVGPPQALRQARATLDPQQFYAVSSPSEAAAREA